MRKMRWTLVAALAFCLQAAAADADEAPSGRQAVYRISVGDRSATGVAVSRDGTVLTALSILSYCPPEGDCPVWVEAPEEGRRLWLRAVVAATDRATGFAVLRTEGPLPAALNLGSRQARPGEPLHAYVYDGNDVRFLAGNVRAVADARYPGEPAAARRAITASMGCPDGAAGTGLVATADDAVLGVLVGTTDDGDAVAVPSSTIRALLDSRRIPYGRPPQRRGRR